MHRPLKNKARQALDTACGGRHVDVTRRNGRAEKVFVYQLPLRFAELYINLRLAGHEQDIVELCLGCHPAWDKKFNGKHLADRFPPESQVKLYEVANEVNFQQALQHIERRKNTMGSLEGMLKRLYAAQADLMREAMIKLTKEVAASAISSLPGLRSSTAHTTNSGTTGASNDSSTPSNNGTPPSGSTPSAPSTPPSVPSTPPSTPPSEAGTPSTR